MRPRSSATTRSPASASSLHTIVPATPAPTTTASTGLSLVIAIVCSWFSFPLNVNDLATNTFYFRLFEPAGIMSFGLEASFDLFGNAGDLLVGALQLHRPCLLTNGSAV